ncbi:PAS domain-containing protein [Prosthecobacter dejongeii]|uniref:histidine kinase n=1 Tax=Prosthecobacter dejongeii TaxID=48465 RepID=A0A7W7YLQ6_9BACT|nr:PAS domain-containing protein [Prosthecobacter dejongeii]MBB5038536.1 PAS domain S-box-containing protein [Prosthecobacter dejongeii]
MEASHLTASISPHSFSVGEHEDHVTRILESITDGFYGFDPQWRFTFVNEAAKRILSAYIESPDALLGHSYWEMFPSAHGTIIETEFLRAVREGVSVEFEVFYTPWERWFSVRGFPIRGGGLSVYFRDVTEDKAVAAALQASEERYRSLFASINDGFCVLEMIWNEDGRAVDYRFVETNLAFEKHTGLKDAHGKTIKEMNPLHEEHWFQIYGRVAKEREPVNFTEGSESLGRWFEVYAFPIGCPEQSQVAVKFTDITERLVAEREMTRLSQESRARLAELETLLEVLPVGIAIANDPQCSHIRLNAAFSKLLEVPHGGNASKTAPEGQIPQHFRVFNDDGVEVPAEQLPMQLAARDGKEIRDCELNLVFSDGRKVRLLEYVSPLFNERGESCGSVGAFLDITERRHAEQRQKFLVSLDDAVRPLSNAEDIVAISARLLGQHLRVDRCAYADIEADEDTMNILGDYTCGVGSIIGRYTFTQFGSHVLALMRANEAYVVEDIFTHEPAPEGTQSYENGQIRAVICVPLHKDGKLVASMAVHMNGPRRWTAEEVSLTQHVANRCWEALERARVTRDLKESESRFRQIADLMPQVVWMARPDGHVEYFNQRWYDFTGRPQREAGDAGWLSVLHPEDAPRCSEVWYHSVRTGAPYEIRYRWYEPATQNYRWFLGRAVALRDERGEIVRWYGTSTDIHDVVKAEEAARQARAEAERASRAKDEFLAALSHELRTPLTPVLMAVEDLCEDPALPGTVRETLRMMQRNVSLEARLIDDLLDLTRITHGKMVLRLQEGDAHALLGHALEIARDEAQAKGLVITLALDATLTQIRCDAARIQQVFWNLLKNAVKFTPTKGSIAIRSYDEEDSLVLEIVDSGIGIPADKLERIFRPFEQAGLTNDHRFGGMGLGLSISKAIVDMHEGSIVAESEGADQGALFRVRLPATRGNEIPSPGDESEGGDSTAKPDPTSASSLRLLIVEDHEPTLAVLSRLLKRAGYQVISATCIAQAEVLAANQKLDFVVSDIGLPDGTGIELMRSLKAQYGLRGIALTGYGMEEDQRQAYDAGFVAHLTKPVEFAQLRRLLAEMAAV